MTSSISSLETIYISYSNASNLKYIDRNASHAALNYVDKAGIHRVIEAAPYNRFDKSFSKGVALLQEHLLSTATLNNDSPFGVLSVHNRFATPKDAAFPTETIVFGQDLSKAWNRIESFSASVALSGYEYRPLSQNSNTFAARALEAAGLPPMKGIDTAGRVHVLPALSGQLTNPNDPARSGNFDPTLSGPANHRQAEIASMNNLRDYQASQAAASRPRPASEGAQQAQRDAAVSRPRPPSEGAQQAQSDARNKASQQSYAKPGWGLDSPSERRGSGGGSGGGGVSSNTKSSSIGGSNSKGSKTSSSGRTSGGLSPTERDERNGNSGSRSASAGKDSKSTNASKASSSSSGSKSSSSKSYSGWDSSGGNKGSNGRMGRVPVFLDLNGNGLTITDTSTSNLFLDIGGDGYKYRTAWVGAGDGVLMIDLDGDGKISDRKEVVFTDWDPSSETDMQALRQVFDTNGNGLLDAGDARWSEFKVMVTNTDGTITQKTLAELGIQSINLAVDETKIAFDGGSTIDGQTTFTRTNGTTGLAATVTVAVDTNGYVVTETQSTDASGDRTIVNRAVDRDGQLVSETTRITSANGLNVTSRFDDDGDGVVDRVLTDVTVINANGSRTQTETMRDGGGILTWSRTTQTSADGKTITIDRDERGGGYPTILSWVQSPQTARMDTSWRAPPVYRGIQMGLGGKQPAAL